MQNAFFLYIFAKQIPATMHYCLDSVASAYAFFHQKWRVYSQSSLPTQRDDIEYAINSYANSMSRHLYNEMSQGRTDFLTNHQSFSDDMVYAIGFLENKLDQLAPRR